VLDAVLLPDRELLVPGGLAFEEARSALPRHRHDRAAPPRHELAHVFADAYELVAHELGPESRKHLSNVLACRTAALGGHLQHCERCGLDRPAYNSCRDRHCPKCQALDQLLWFEARLARALPVPYFHVVATVPGALRPYFLADKAVLYALLMRAASRVVLDLAQERLGGARAGLVAVLHTWNAQWSYHPHVHMIVPAGGLDEHGEWVGAPKGRCLLPVDLLRERFALALLAAIEGALAAGALVKTDGLEATLERLSDPEVYWHAYAKRTLRAEEALGYLARYACRPGFSNDRILSYDGETVVYATKHGGKVEKKNVELLRLAVKHELPKGFMRIRHYGILSGRTVARSVTLARASLALQGVSTPPAPARPAGETWDQRLKRVSGLDVNVCPRCEGPVTRIPFVNEAHERQLRATLAVACKRRLSRGRDP